MKKIVLLVLISICSLIFISCQKKAFKDNTVRPVYTYVDTEKLPDGTYHSEFIKENLTEENGDMYLKVFIFSKDVYDPNDIKKVKVGNKIERYGEDEKIENVIWDDSKTTFCINFPSFEDAQEVYAPMEDGMYVLRGPDDHATYTNRGEGKYKISKTCKLVDASEDWIGGPGVKTIEYDNIKDFIFNEEYEFFNYLNTTIKIENNEIVEINRRYIP